MRYVDRYGFSASIKWIVFAYRVVVKDANGKRRFSGTYYRRGSAEEAIKRYGSHWHRVHLFGRVDSEYL